MHCLTTFREWGPRERLLAFCQLSANRAVLIITHICPSPQSCLCPTLPCLLRAKVAATGQRGGCHCLVARGIYEPFFQASGERYHVEPHPEHLCGAYPYAYPPMPPMGPHHAFKDWSQIRYPPPAMPMEHPPPLPNSHLFHLVSLCPSFLQILSRKEDRPSGGWG